MLLYALTAVYEIRCLIVSYRTRRYVRHILVQTEDMAKMCLEQIKEGADFGELASSISDCKATREKGGEVRNNTAVAHNLPPSHSSTTAVCTGTLPVVLLSCCSAVYSSSPAVALLLYSNDASSVAYRS